MNKQGAVEPGTALTVPESASNALLAILAGSSADGDGATAAVDMATGLTLSQKGEIRAMLLGVAERVAALQEGNAQDAEARALTLRQMSERTRAAFQAASDSDGSREEEPTAKEEAAPARRDQKPLEVDEEPSVASTQNGRGKWWGRGAERVSAAKAVVSKAPPSSPPASGKEPEFASVVEAVEHYFRQCGDGQAVATRDVITWATSEGRGWSSSGVNNAILTLKRRGVLEGAGYGKARLVSNEGGVARTTARKGGVRDKLVEVLRAAGPSGYTYEEWCSAARKAGTEVSVKALQQHTLKGHGVFVKISHGRTARFVTAEFAPVDGDADRGGEGAPSDDDESTGAVKRAPPPAPGKKRRGRPPKASKAEKPKAEKTRMAIKRNALSGSWPLGLSAKLFPEARVVPRTEDDLARFILWPLICCFWQVRFDALVLVAADVVHRMFGVSMMPDQIEALVQRGVLALQDKGKVKIGGDRMTITLADEGQRLPAQIPVPVEIVRIEARPVPRGLVNFACQMARNRGSVSLGDVASEFSLSGRMGVTDEDVYDALSRAKCLDQTVFFADGILYAQHEDAVATTRHVMDTTES